MPVCRIACQTGNFQPQHDPGVTQADLRDQLLKTGPVGSGGAGQAEVAVDDMDLVQWPTKRHGPLA